MVTRRIQLDKLTGRINIALMALGISQVLTGIVATLAIFLFVSHETLELVGEEIMMPGREFVADIIRVLVFAAPDN